MLTYAEFMAVLAFVSKKASFGQDLEAVELLKQLEAVKQSYCGGNNE